MNNIFLIVGARPNFIKAAAILVAAKKQNVVIDLIHTGQHYDATMSDIFFQELHIDPPLVNLGIATLATYGEFLYKCKTRFIELFSVYKPKIVIVVGDVISSLAAALAANITKTTLIHVEAGLRSFDYTMPEELNRILIDSVSDFFFVTEPAGVENLKKEGKEHNVYLVGNTMIDTLYANLAAINHRKYCRELHLKEDEYVVMTIHRPSNVGSNLIDILKNINKIGCDLPIIFPVHPKIGSNLAHLNLKNVKLISPLGYFEFLSLVLDCKFVITDSGGLQEETSALGIPCLTLRNNTERPITIERGTNTLVGQDYPALLRAVNNIMANECVKLAELIWDGKAGSRIISTLRTIL